MNNWLQKQWTTYTFWHLLLIPLSWLFGAIVYLRKSLYQLGLIKSFRLNAPVIVVGNINVGGTGKTPFVIWLVEQLQLAGYKPGIVSRGYGGSHKVVQAVFSDSSPAEVGDEPVLIVKRTGSPMFVGANRVDAGVALLQAHPECNVIISDDGLQHYRLKRDIEIALVNTNTLSNSNLCLLPAGSLREKVARLQTVDAVVNSATILTDSYFKKNSGLQVPVFNMQLHGNTLISLDGAQIHQPAEFFANKSIIAIAGIGNPDRFFNQLTSLGLQFERKVFSDHHAFAAQDLTPFKNDTILMTEKDAVKCQMFTPANAWYLPVTATLTSFNGNTLIAHVLQKLNKIN
ncbi:MAG TPA: tetraacyldisaccharide 4'-kinase [Methylotenera sp.]|nr:tetraacyldisaccharide 4'-kinase [Methylotenera sp.]